MNKGQWPSAPSRYLQTRQGRKPGRTAFPRDRLVPEGQQLGELARAQARFLGGNSSVFDNMGGEGAFVMVSEDNIIAELLLPCNTPKDNILIVRINCNS